MLHEQGRCTVNEVGKHAEVPADRGEYRPGNERVAHATVNGHEVTIHNYRDSIYSADGSAETRWTTETFDVRDITNVWVYFTHFSSVNGVAHSEVGFEFADGRCALASFEIRPLAGQRFDIIKGMRQTLEITLRWASEREMLTRRFLQESKSRMYMFEADITHSLAIQLFGAFVDRTNELHETPEWYHTTRKNCASSIVELVDEILPGHLRATHRVMLPGTLPKYWSKRGVLKYEGDFKTAFDEAFITERARAVGDVPDFSIRFHGRTQLM